MLRSFETLPHQADVKRSQCWKDDHVELPFPGDEPEPPPHADDAADGGCETIAYAGWKRSVPRIGNALPRDTCSRLEVP